MANVTIFGFIVMSLLFSRAPLARSPQTLCLLLLLLICIAATASGPTVKEDATRHVHDPVIIKCGSYYYVFSTGVGIPIRRSKDLVNWERIGKVFAKNLPAWAEQEVPGVKGLWAPDISFRDGKYWLYYSVSTFGNNGSRIGLATNTTLDPADPNYRWTDEGVVYASEPSDDFNAIDPNIAIVEKDRIVMTFGSFWSGIKLIDIDPSTGKPWPGQDKLVSVASRPEEKAVEAPFLIRHGDYYYLFVSFGACCKGVDTKYDVRVGRARKPEGPYEDRDGVNMMEGGATLILETKTHVRGPGHCAVLQDGPKDYLVHHFYDARDNGLPHLQIRPISWSDDGWPTVGEPLGSRRLKASSHYFALCRIP